MSNVRFAHVSDLHLPFEPTLSGLQKMSKRQLSVWSWRQRRALHPPTILGALTRDLQEQKLDHVLVTGDLINFSLPSEYVQAARWLESLAPVDRISIVPGNHDALVPVPHEQGLGVWQRWTRVYAGWPAVHRLGDVAFIGLDSAVPTAPLLARGRLGDEQLQRLEALLTAEGAANRTRVVMLHHPPAAGAISWRKALADAPALRGVLRRCGAELVLHGHARDARLDSVAGPTEPIPCLGVPSSTAVPSGKDQGARWHRLALLGTGGDNPRVEVEVRRWSPDAGRFAAQETFLLCLPRKPSPLGAAAGHRPPPLPTLVPARP